MLVIKYFQTKLEAKRCFLLAPQGPAASLRPTFANVCQIKSETNGYHSINWNVKCEYTE